MREIVVIGGGIAGLSAAIYLGRAQRDTLVIDSGHSMAKWEPKVENYLGFPTGVDGADLLKFGREQAERYDVEFAEDEIVSVKNENNIFICRGKHRGYRTQRLLIATGIFHIPPEIPGVRECLGHSMFFAKIVMDIVSVENESPSLAGTMRPSSTRWACSIIRPASS